MPIFKYTVANKEGKKLSGTVEAPYEETARKELNNLGFSILELKEIKEEIEEQNKKNAKQNPKYIFEAIDKSSQLINGSIPAKSEAEALQRLKKEYELNVTAIWKENSSDEEIEKAKNEGTQRFQDEVKKTLTAKEKEIEKIDNAEAKKRENFVRNKVNHILDEVFNLLKEFDEKLDAKQKVEINKKIDKLLRIKNSTNLDYILATAENLLEFIREQEKSLKNKGFQDERFEFKLQTKSLLDELKQSQKTKTLSEDILSKIQNWQLRHTKEGSTNPQGIINSILNSIKNFLKTPEEIKNAKLEIQTYNKQIWEFIKLYIKEPTPEYKEKAKNSIKILLKKRKETKTRIQTLKKEFKSNEKNKRIKTKNHLISFIKEVNSLSGWILAFYIIYYFISIYIKSKDFGINDIPKGFAIYESHVFKYILAVIFLLHAGTSAKINYFPKSRIANIVLPTLFMIGTIITLLNF